MASATLNSFGVFADEVYSSTDLNRRSAEVLNHARLRPVTISRNNEQFALFRREQAASLVRSADRSSAVITLLSELHLVIKGEHPSPAFQWLKIFEKEDLQKFCGELLLAAAKVATAFASSRLTDWDEVDAVIHEWRESAAVAQSGVLDHAMFTNEAETDLPDPRNIVKESESVCPQTS